MKHKRVAAIVPAYNEEETIGGVVSALRASLLIDDVVVVDDGSTDNTATVAGLAGATRVIRQQNRGKGEAVARGISESDADVIFLCDADLQGFTSWHANRVIAPVLDGSVPMTIGLRDLGSFFPSLGGERAFTLDVYRRVPRRLISGWRLEAGLNHAARRFTYVRMPGVRIRQKVQKVGWVRGVLQYAKMYLEVADAWLAASWGSL